MTRGNPVDGFVLFALLAIVALLLEPKFTFLFAALAVASLLRTK